MAGVTLYEPESVDVVSVQGRVRVLHVLLWNKVNIICFVQAWPTFNMPNNAMLTL